MMTYKTKDVNGNEVELPWSSAKEIFEAYEKECLREDILLELDVVCANEGLDMEKVSAATLDKLIDEYKDYRESDENWRTGVNNAIDRYIEDIRDEAKPTGKNKPIERD